MLLPTGFVKVEHLPEFTVENWEMDHGVPAGIPTGTEWLNSLAPMLATKELALRN
jgi:hypothetical protein